MVGPGYLRIFPLSLVLLLVSLPSAGNEFELISAPYPETCVPFDNGVCSEGGVVYKTRNGYRPLRLDLYFPPDVKSRNDWPLVIYIHGGAWKVGSPRGETSGLPLPGMLASIARQGFVVAAPEYRLDQEATFPGAIDDIQESIRFLRNQAGALPVNPDKIAVWGASAGGQLAALAAVSCGSRTFVPASEIPTDESNRQSPCVQGGISWYGVHNFASIKTPPGQPGPAAYLGCQTTPCPRDSLSGASPVTYVDGQDPPLLLVHGGKDTLVDVAQTHEFEAALKAAEVSLKKIIIEDVDHGFTGATPEQTRQAQRSALADSVAFLENLFHSDSTGTVNK